MIQANIRLSLSLFLRNDDSILELSPQQKYMLWAGFTAAKKMLALRWQPQHLLPWQQWANLFLDIIMKERSMIRMHEASQK